MNSETRFVLEFLFWFTLYLFLPSVVVIPLILVVVGWRFFQIWEMRKREERKREVAILRKVARKELRLLEKFKKVEVDSADWWKSN